MNWMQKLLVRISPASPEDEEEKTREYEERRHRRLVRVRAEVDAEIEVPDADDLGRWFGFDGGPSDPGASPDRGGDGDAR